MVFNDYLVEFKLRRTKTQRFEKIPNTGLRGVLGIRNKHIYPNIFYFLLKVAYTLSVSTSSAVRMFICIWRSQWLYTYIDSCLQVKKNVVEYEEWGDR